MLARYGYCVFPTSMPDIQEGGSIHTRYGPPAIWKLIGSPVLLAVTINANYKQQQWNYLSNCSN